MSQFRERFDAATLAAGVPIGSTFTDVFGEWTVIGPSELTESADDQESIYVQDVRDPDGNLVRSAVEALLQYTKGGK